MEKHEFNSEWVQKARNGDQDAIADLYHYCQQSVYLTIKSLIKSDEDTVLDLLQDTFVTAITSLGELGRDEKFPIWVKVIGRNKTLDWLRKKKPITFSAMSGNENDFEIQIEDDRTYQMPEVELDEKETARMIREILDSLSDGQRMTVSMFYYQDMSISEIARRVGCSVGTVKAQLYNGRKAIEKKIRELEKQGVKLYGIMPIPFFIMLLHNMEQYAVPMDPSILSNITSAATSISSVGHDAPETVDTKVAHDAQNVGQILRQAGRSVGKVVGGAAKGKIAVGMIVAAVVGGGAMSGLNYWNSHHAEPTGSPGKNQMEENQVVQDDSDIRLIKVESDPILAAYQQELFRMQSNGAFLQYAHLIDLNDDGVDELIVLLDDVELSIYTYNAENQNAETVAKISDAINYISKGMTYQQEQEMGYFPYLGIYLSLNEQKLVVGTGDDQDQTKATRFVISGNDGAWKTDEYRTENNEYWCNGIKISEEDYVTATEKNYSSFADEFEQDNLEAILNYDPNGTVDLSDVDRVYAEYLTRCLEQNAYLSEFAEKPVKFQLIYINDDDIPELALTSGSAFACSVELFTYNHRILQSLGHAFGSNGTIYYREKIFSCPKLIKIQEQRLNMKFEMEKQRCCTNQHLSMCMLKMGSRKMRKLTQ